MNKNKMLETHILGNWFGVDEILFGEKSAKDSLSEEAYKNYITTKAALLSNLFELYLKLEYFTDSKFSTEKELKEFYTNYAKIVKEKSLNEMNTSEIVAELKEDVERIVESEEKDKSKVADIVLERAYKVFSLDNLLVAEAITGGCASCVKDFEGKVLIGSYRTLRDKLIEMVL